MTENRKETSDAFADRIRQLRIERFGDERGARSSAAEAMGISPAEWQGYESGVLPGVDRLVQICRVFECDANWLLGLNGNGRRNGLSESQKRFIREMLDLSEMIHTFDAVHTRFLNVLPEALEDPAVAQESCHRLYDLAKQVKKLFRQMQTSGIPEPPEG